MLELGDAQGEVVDLLATGEPEAVERALDGVVAADSEPLGLPAPGRCRVVHGRTHLRHVDPDLACELVRELVERLDPDRRPPHAGEEEPAQREPDAIAFDVRPGVVHA